MVFQDVLQLHEQHIYEMFRGNHIFLHYIFYTIHKEQHINTLQVCHYLIISDKVVWRSVRRLQWTVFVLRWVNAMRIFTIFITKITSPIWYSPRPLLAKLLHFLLMFPSKQDSPKFPYKRNILVPKYIRVANSILLASEKIKIKNTISKDFMLRFAV